VKAHLPAVFFPTRTGAAPAEKGRFAPLESAYHHGKKSWGWSMRPDVVSHYEVLEPIGRGGMGVVHRGRDLRLPRDVALKFLSPERLASAEDRERFFREAQALSSLHHPHIAVLYEVDDHAGTPFMALEHLSGGTLHQRILAARQARKELPLATVLDWTIGLAEALGHAHAHGIVHRDVKSSNAMFDDEGRVKLTDFGLAKSRGASDLTASGTIPGTVSYMAPEQLRGSEADARADLYSLGVVLYEAATGHLPFRGASAAETIERILHEAPEPASRTRTGLLPAFDRVLARLLAKAPEARYPDAAALLHDLRALRSGELAAADAPTASAGSTAAAGARGDPRLLAIGGLVAAIALAAGAYVSVRPPAMPERKQVVVLPIRCIGAGAEQQTLCDGLTETLTTALAQVGAFAVVPASETRKITSVEQARREFGVNLVVYASLVRQGGEARLSLSLVDAETKRTMATETVRGSVGTLYEQEDGVLAKLADLVGIAVPTGDASVLAATSARVPAAFEAYLKGRGLLFRFDKEGNRERALHEFEEAVRLDPQSALAYAGIAEVHLQLYRARHEPERLEAARASAERALALSPELGGARVTLGAVLAEVGAPEEALAHLEAALRADPRDAAAYRELASVYRGQKRFEEAVAVYERAIRARPNDWMTHADFARFLYGQQRLSEAAAEYRKVIDLSPDNHLGYRNLGGVLHDMGDDAQAEQMLLKAQALHATARGLSNLGTVYMTQGRYREAVQALAGASELAATEAPNDYLIWGNLGDARWLAAGRLEDGRPAWRHAAEVAEGRLARRPDDADLLAVLAEYYAKLGERVLARERVGSALEHAPDSAFIHYQAGVVHALLDEPGEAIAELQVALRHGDVATQIQQAPELRGLRASPGFGGLDLAQTRRSP